MAQPTILSSPPERTSNQPYRRCGNTHPGSGYQCEQEAGHLGQCVVTVLFYWQADANGEPAGKARVRMGEVRGR